MTVAGLSLPRGWDDITPDWMTVALSRHHPGAVVDGVQVALRDDGTNRRARLALTYGTGSGPATVFAKAVDPDHAELVALTSGLYHEPRLFSSGVELGLDHPTVYLALIDESRRDFVKKVGAATTGAVAAGSAPYVFAQSNPIKWRLQTYSGAPLGAHVILPQIEAFNRAAHGQMEIEL